MTLQLINHSVTAIRNALADRSGGKRVLVKFFDQPVPERIFDVSAPHGAVRIKTLRDTKWKFLDDRDQVYIVKIGSYT